jgi:hypothetical protein
VLLENLFVADELLLYVTLLILACVSSIIIVASKLFVDYYMNDTEVGISCLCM